MQVETETLTSGNFIGITIVRTLHTGLRIEVSFSNLDSPEDR